MEKQTSMMEERLKAQVQKEIANLRKLSEECINTRTWRLAHCVDSAIRMLQTAQLHPGEKA